MNMARILACSPFPLHVTRFITGCALNVITGLDPIYTSCDSASILQTSLYNNHQPPA